MAEFISWVRDNWAGVLATIGGIVGVATFRQAAEKADRDEYAMLVQQHNALGAEARERRDLDRILLANVNLEHEPPTAVEMMFLNDVIVHFESGWKLALKNTVLTQKTYTADVRKFFSHPLPREVWERTKDGRNPEFVRFIERAIERNGRLSATGD
jgi:hypothetical protein